MARVPLPPAEPMTLTVLAEIASGGMGSVEMARVESGPHAGQVLGIKRLHSSIANDKTFVDMFLDEAWLTAAMKSPHVMGVVAHGTDERGMFLAVELIEGVPLSRLLKEARVKKEAFSEQVVASITMQICEGLIEAHGLKGTDGKPLGLVHRDLTPGNVLVAFDGMVKIVDFGIAKAEERITHTRTGTMKGKPAYMAPEQAKGGKNMDHRADLFSLGVMVFELLAGRRPWIEKSAFDVIMSAALKPHPNLADVRAGVNPVFVEIVDKCLAKKAADRWSSAAEIRDRLIEWRKGQSFAKPDMEVVRDFVVRHSAAQIEWFRRAHLGEFMKGQAQTFKELEEAIDDARKRSGDAPYSIAPTSGGRSAFDSMTPSRAKLVLVDESAPASGQTPPPQTPPAHDGATGRASAPYAPNPAAAAPTPGTEPTPLSPGATRAGGVVKTSSSPTMPSLNEASRIAQARASQPPSTTPLPGSPSPSDFSKSLPPTEKLPDLPAGRANPDLQMTARSADGGLGGTIALGEGDLEFEGPPKSGSFGPQSGLRKGLGGTEYMEVSPLKGMKLPEPRIEHAPDDSDLSATIRMPELADRPIRDADGSSRSVVRPAGAMLADDDLALGATMRSDDAAPVPVREILKRASESPPAPDPGRQEATRQTGWNLRNQAQAAAPPEPKGLSGTTVLLLILVAFILGGAIAAYVAKTYLVKSGNTWEPSGTAVAMAETGGCLTTSGLRPRPRPSAEPQPPVAACAE